MAHVLALPAELVRLILSHLGAQPLLRFAGSCHEGATAASADALWLGLVRAIWEGEMPPLSAGAAQEFYRCMRQPPAVMTASAPALSAGVLPLPLSHLVNEPLTWQEGSGSFLGEYRLLVELILEADGATLLTAVYQPFDGMFSPAGDFGSSSAGKWTSFENYGWTAATFSTAAPPPEALCGPPLARTHDSAGAFIPWSQRPSGLLVHSAEEAQWLRDAFGPDEFKRGGVVRLSARLCVQWQDKVVCLGVAPGVRDALDAGRDSCMLKFEWDMPAIAVPDEIASVMWGHGSEGPSARMRCISPYLYVDLEPCSAARDTWKACSLELGARPQFPDSLPEGYSYNFNGPYQGFRDHCRSDMMALCFLHEAMAMPRRSIDAYTQ